MQTAEDMYGLSWEQPLKAQALQYTEVQVTPKPRRTLQPVAGVWWRLPVCAQATACVPGAAAAAPARRLLRPPLDDALWMVAGPSWLTYGAFLSSAQDVSTLALLTLSTGEHYASCGARSCKRRQRTLCAAG